MSVIREQITEYKGNIKKLIKSKEQEQLRLKRSVRIIIYFWTFITAISFGLNLWHEDRQIKTVIESAARTNIIKDQSFRHWVASHGGIYVPTTKSTPPNPNLANIPHRDIEKPDGTKLTLMNPAYMLRHMVEKHPGLYGAKEKITSLKYLYAGNKPDEWETKALKSFEQGEKEALEYLEIENKPFLRLMHPEYIKKSCLKCHGNQGYKVGDVRGGIEVTIPLQELYDSSLHHSYIIFLGHFGLWLLVLAGILISSLKRSIYLQEKSNTQQSLKESEFLLNESQRIAHVGSWKYDISADLLTCSGEAHSIFEADTNIRAISYNQFLEMVHPQDRERVEQSYKNSLKNKDSYNIIYRLLMKDGRIKFIEEVSETHFDADGQALISIGTVQDITKQKELENALLTSQRQFEVFMHHAPANVLIMDNSDRIIYANNSTETFFGINNIFGKNIKDLLSADDALYFHDFDNRVFKDGIVEEIREFVNEKNEKFIFRIMGFSMLYNNMKQLGIIFIDITQTYQDRQKLKEQEELMLIQSRHAAMGEMISMIAHQWRQPITTISMDANIILADIELDTVDEENLKEASKDIINQTQELSRTIDDFRNFFKQNREKEDVLVTDIFMEAYAIIDKSMENSNIDVQNFFDSNTKVLIYSRELLQVFINILKNSKEALSENNKNDKKITNTIYETPSSVIIKICDNGGGIDKGIIDKIFNPYFSTKDEQNGTGLGLYMSKTIIEKHLNGKLSVENINDTNGTRIGICFIIELFKKSKKDA